MKNVQLFIITIISLVFLASCATSNKIDKYNNASSYVDDFPDHFMQYQIYHQNDSLSELSVRIDAEKIPSLKKKQVDVYSLMRLTFGVYTSMNKQDIVQSASYKLSDIIAYEDINKAASEIQIPLHLEDNKHYVVLLSVQDQVNKRNYFKLIRIDKNKNSAENFRLLNENNTTFWGNWIEPKERIKLQYRYANIPSVLVDYYRAEFSPAIPPFVENISNDIGDKKPFEQYEIALSQGYSSLIQPPHKGVYAIKDKNQSNYIKAFPQFYSDYPLKLTDAQKVFTLRYLNNKKEFKLMLQDEAKHTVEEFWFFEDRTKERSAEMMGSYYARVIRANQLFTTYKEGWKTDRGMIFMVYGPPDFVYNEADREIWDYGDEADYNNLRFEFIIQTSSFNTQEFILLRSDSFRESWYSAVENWRNK